MFSAPFETFSITVIIFDYLRKVFHVTFKSRSPFQYIKCQHHIQLILVEVFRSFLQRFSY